GLTREPIREKWQTPCASVMLVAQADQGRFEFLWFGDCGALFEKAGKIVLVGEALEKRKAEAERARRIAREKKISAAAGINRPEIEPLLRAARNRINSGSNWLFSPDVRAASHVSRKTLMLSQGASLLIASDRFLALVTDYD